MSTDFSRNPPNPEKITSEFHISMNAANQCLHVNFDFNQIVKSDTKKCKAKLVFIAHRLVENKTLNPFDRAESYSRSLHVDWILLSDRIEELH